MYYVALKNFVASMVEGGADTLAHVHGGMVVLMLARLITRRSLADWFGWMDFVDAGSFAQLDRYIGYYESYADSHTTYDRDTAFQEEVRNGARAVAEAVREIRAGRVAVSQHRLRDPRPK